MLAFTKLRQNLKKDFSSFKKLRIAILCDSSSQLLQQGLRGYGYERQLNYEIFEADYDQVEQQVLNPSSELYAFAPDVILLAKNSHKLLHRFYKLSNKERSVFANTIREEKDQLIDAIQQQLASKIILFNYQEIDDKVFGNYANNKSFSFLYQVKKLNLLLMEKAQTHSNLFICDVQQLTMDCGWQKAIDNKSYITADIIWSLDFLPALVKNISGQIEAIYGSFKKCLILDLDNTLWGGVIGDDGLEGIQIGNYGIGKAFTALQLWVKELKGRGIIICVCSKNTEAIAKEAFEKHPEMVLRLDDVAVFAVNWNNKVDNIHFIQNTLNIGFDSMVFLDDNPFERSMVKEAIPSLEVPELPEDPAEYLSYVQSLNLFETASYSEEDLLRTQLYKAEANRTSHQNIYKNEDEFLSSLQMHAEVLPLNNFTIPRAAQLSQRSNQFNLRTVRYTEQDLKSISASPDYFSFAVKLKDKFGDNGIISLLITKKEENKNLFIESWLMSCRVLKRGMENFVLNTIADIAIANGFRNITGEYLITPKNGIVKDHYSDLGFELQSGLWHLDIESFQKRKTFIETASAIAETA